MLKSSRSSSSSRAHAAAADDDDNAAVAAAAAAPHHHHHHHHHPLSSLAIKANLLIVLLVLLAVGLPDGAQAAPYYNAFKRAGGGRLDSCIDSNGMERQLRSDGLNFYLAGLAKCVASVGRPRFGKRSGLGAPLNLNLAADADADRNSVSPSSSLPAYFFHYTPPASSEGGAVAVDEDQSAASADLGHAPYPGHASLDALARELAMRRRPARSVGSAVRFGPAKERQIQGYRLFNNNYGQEKN